MATMTAPQPRRRWLPFVRDDDFERHLREDADIHSAAKKTSDEILAGIDAANLSITDLANKLKPIIPIANDLDQMVGQRKFRHQLYCLATRIGHSIKKIIGWGGGTIVGLATLAAVYPPANNLLLWLLGKLTFGAIATSRLPAITATPTIPGLTH